MASKNQEAVGIHNQIELLREHTLGRGHGNIKKKKPSGPFVCENSSTKFLIIVENKTLKHFWNMIPIESKLDQVAPYAPISIRKIKPGDN